jgi:hypothetical protein
MRAPIKLNRDTWPAIMHSLVPSANDPRILLGDHIDETSFSRAVSSFKFGSKLKATQKDRFPLTIRALCELEFPRPPVVLDVGCSDGINSLDVMQLLAFTRYYATDLNAEAFCKMDNGRTYFYNLNGEPILIASKWWVIYSDVDGAIAPFGQIVSRILRKTPPMDREAVKIKLINPTLQKKLGDRVIFKRHDVLQPWTGERIDLALAANILNRCYFPDSHLAQAVINLGTTLNDGGYLTIIDNRKIEQSTIFQMNSGTAQVVRQINGGTEIEALALQALSSKHTTLAMESSGGEK